ncbi:hypothetical protein ACN23B_16605 [Anabaena sp. FACHB-709]|uniref:Uncharacterized protein n=2 Tax=Nostocaceae TaxID=1162 RepID=A0A1Z4KJ80_ANAVA|nr:MULTISPECIES: hypothetical protein [Nostocaceae]BAY68933.1 hypothetical protein NIES23_17230 [Trichormus variabilis NIES-23]MBD2170506.1 hypothetical protein [Anabaena cylindrica FACHB-318]MBD2262018.1 hypothetical protein [Anabaena sp. FACHB-709]MBD2271839.1 hypothetical protein [Nostoc sp. PCC 7120 = FACHB-418]MBD2282127.1 hypothetical protein [Anabaena cylindrica FACHB-170]
MRDHLHNEKGKFYWKILLKLMIYGTCSTILFTASIVIVKSLFFYFSSITKSSYPTSVPWIDSQYECEYTGRTWNENQCWDKEQSPWF